MTHPPPDIEPIEFRVTGRRRFVIWRDIVFPTLIGIVAFFAIAGVSVWFWR